jgi:hypothetical protein
MGSAQRHIEHSDSTTVTYLENYYMSISLETALLSRAGIKEIEGKTIFLLLSPF